jgi:hypothetical protein
MSAVYDIDNIEVNEHDISILEGLMENEENELMFFQMAYVDNKENASYVHYLMKHFTNYVQGKFDQETENNKSIGTFLYGLSENTIMGEFLIEWSTFMTNNLSSSESMEILTLLLKNVHTCVHKKLGKDMITQQNTDKCNITHKIWSIEHFRKTIKHFPVLETGQSYMDNGFLSSFHTKKKWYDNYSEVIGALTPLIEDKSIHDDIVNQMWNMFNMNIAYTTGNVEMIDKKKCSTICYNNVLLTFIIKLFRSYDVENIIYNIKKYERFNVSEYAIDNLPFDVKLCVTVMYGINIAYMPLTSQMKSLKSDIRYASSSTPHYPPQYGGIARFKQDLETKLARTKALYELNKEDVMHLYRSYSSISNIIVSDLIFTDVITYVGESYKSFDGDYMLLEFVSEIVGGMNNTCKNEHTRYYATDLVFLITDELGYSCFGQKLLQNMVNYLNDVNYFKWSMLQRAISHHKNILTLVIMLLDSPNVLVENSESILVGMLFNLTKTALNMYSKADDIIQSVRDSYSASSRKLINLPKEVKDIYVDLINIIIFTLEVTADMYHKKKVINQYKELENQIVTLITDTFIRMTNGSSDMFVLVKMPKMASDVTMCAINLLNIYCSPYMLDNMCYNKQLFIDGINSSKIVEATKMKLTEMFSQYVEPDEIEYPSEFYDPFSCIEIVDPVLLPKINVMHDKTTIIAAIRHNPINPHTREPLTEQILNEYNELPEIKQKISEFLELKEKIRCESLP